MKFKELFEEVLKESLSTEEQEWAEKHGHKRPNFFYSGDERLSWERGIKRKMKIAALQDRVKEVDSQISQAKDEKTKAALEKKKDSLETKIARIDPD